MHEYTRGLLNAVPKLTGERERLESIPGLVANAMDLPDGCRFHPRCKNCTEKCKSEMPAMIKLNEDHYVSCWNAGVEK